MMTFKFTFLHYIKKALQPLLFSVSCLQKGW